VGPAKAQFETLQHFTTTAAARDIAFAMQDVGTQNTIYGVSYGTYVANRILQVFDEQHPSYPTSVVLDGVATSDSCRSIVNYDSNFNLAGLRALPMCDADPFCSSKFAEYGGATSASLNLFEEVREGTNVCANRLAKERNLKLTSYTLSLIGGELIKQGIMRPLALAFLYRLLRCNDADLDVVQYAVSQRPPQPGPGVPPSSTPTPVPPWNFSIAAYSIIMTELWGTETDYNRNASQPCSQLADKSSQALFQTGVTNTFCPPHQAWPKYELDEHVGQFAAPSSNRTKILILNGDLDPETPIAWANHAAQTYEQLGCGVSFISVPGTTHAVVYSTPLVDADGHMLLQEMCGVYLSASFLASDGLYTNKTCLTQLAKTDWKNAESITQTMGTNKFGTSDIWG